MRCGIKLPAKLLAVLTAAAIMCSCIPALAEEGEAASTPFKSLSIPGEINACDFDKGGRGVAYSDNGTDMVSQSSYRPDEYLNLTDQSYGTVVGINKGQWLQFTVKVQKDGYYDMTAFYAVPDPGVIFTVELDGKSIASSELSPTGGWVTEGSQNIGSASLKAGTHTMRYKVLAGGVTFTKVVFTKSEEETDGKQIDFSKKSGSYRTFCLPTVIQAEDYDLGPAGCRSSDGRNSGGEYRKNDPMDLFKGEGRYYLVMENGESVTYTFQAEYSGAYELSFAAGSSCSVNVYFDGCPRPLAVKLAGSSAYPETKAASIYLPAGQHSVRLEAASGNTNIDYLRFLSASDAAVTLESLRDTSGGDENVLEEVSQNKVYQNLYVSPNGDDSGSGSEDAPFLTIGRAKQEVERLAPGMDGDLVVNILPGYYPIEQTEVFTDAHSGQNGYNVVFRGTNRLSPPVLSGGVQVTGWEKTDTKLWKAPLTGVEEVRNLYVNGFMAQRARSKYLYEAVDTYHAPDSQYKEDGFKVSANNFPESFAHPQDLELVWNMVWTSQRTAVRDVIREGSLVSIVMDQPYHNWNMTKEYELTTPAVSKQFYMENALELLDEPGEFYYDKYDQTIYYYPFREEDLTTAETYVGKTQFLFQVIGADLQHKASHIVFDNLDIRYGAWPEASTTGVVVFQADKRVTGPDNIISDGSAIVPAQFEVAVADNIVIQNCRFLNLGSGAVSMENAVSDSVVNGNVFKDISGTAVIVGSWEHNKDRGPLSEMCKNIAVTNNVIRRASAEFQGGTGITAYYVNNVRIEHNDMKELPYTGVSLSWGWGEDVKGVGDNSISYNRIDDVTYPTHDGAHIYTLGPLRNTVINNNYLIKAGDFRGGIYTDAGSAYLTVKNNVVEQSKNWLFIWADAMHDIVATNNFSDTSELTNNGTNITLADNVTVADRNWPAAAQKIIEESGVTPQYRRLLSGVERPEWRTAFSKVCPVKVYTPKGSDWIQAEDFMTGGEGVGYHKLEQGNQDKVYRDEGVDIIDQNVRIVIGNTKPGEWLKYEVDTPEAGDYNLDLKTANAFEDGSPQPKVNVYVDDVLMVDAFPIPKSANWELHNPTTVGRFEMAQGKHVVKIEFVDNGFSFDCFKFYQEEVIGNEPEYDEGVLVEETYVPPVQFTDIKGHWAEKDIQEMAELGMVRGKEGTWFAPDDTVTLIEASVMAMRAAGLKFDEDSPNRAALEYGLASETERWDAPLTRERFAAVLMQAYIEEHRVYQITVDPNAFADAAEILPEYLNAVLGVKELKLMWGSENNLFHPRDFLTRAEATVVMKRLRQLEG